MYLQNINKQHTAWEQLKKRATDEGIKIAEFIFDEYAPAWVSKTVTALKTGLRQS